MPAVVTREFLYGYVAWCDECQDGVRWSSRAKPADWAYRHNTDRHPDTH